MLCRQHTTMGLRSATLAALAATVAGHGAIISPRSRNSVDYLVSCSGIPGPGSIMPRSHIMPRRWASTPPRTGPRTRTAPTSRAPTPGTATTVVRSPAPTLSFPSVRAPDLGWAAREQRPASTTARAASSAAPRAITNPGAARSISAGWARRPRSTTPSTAP